MVKAIPVIGVLLAITLSGCSAPGGVPSSSKSSTATAAPPATLPRPEPDWINNESARYGRIEYITKKADANNIEQARQAARDKIITLFTYVDPNIKGNTLKNSSATLIATAAPEIVSAITVVDEWQSPDTKTFYALAAMQRNHGESYMKTKIPQLDQETQKLIDASAIKNIDPLRRTGILAKALRHKNSANICNSRCVLSMSPAVVSKPYGMWCALRPILKSNSNNSKFSLQLLQMTTLRPKSWPIC